MHSPHPRGQVLVIVAASMVVLLGVAALVIDLGFSWMLRRDEQNAADPAALAAARHIPADNVPAMWTAACFYAQRNGFFESDADCNAAITGGDLVVHYPPQGPLAGDFAGRAGFVQVVISETHPTFFGRIYGQSEARVTTSAVAAWTTGESNSSSLVALDPRGCDAISEATAKFSGGGTVVISPVVDPDDPAGNPYEGGWVHINSSCDTTGQDNICGSGSGKSALKVSGGGTLDVSSSGAYVVGTCKADGGGSVLGPVNEGWIPIGDPLGQLRPPSWQAVVAAYGYVTCPGETTPLTETSTSGCDLDASHCGGDVCTLEPGVYFGGLEVKKKDLQVELQPGLYYVAGGGIRVGTDASIASVIGDPGVDARIMLFSTDHPTKCPSTPQMCQGPIQFGAQTSFSAKAINTTVCLTSPHEITCPYRGILIWQDRNGTLLDNEVSLGGQNSSVIAGTIYAPEELVDLNGGSSGDGCFGSPPACLSVQIISWQFNITGGGMLHMPYDPGELYQIEQKGLVH